MGDNWRRDLDSESSEYYDNESSEPESSEAQRYFDKAQRRILRAIRDDEDRFDSNREFLQLQKAYKGFFQILTRFFKKKDSVPTYLEISDRNRKSRNRIKGRTQDALEELVEKVVDDPTADKYLAVSMTFPRSSRISKQTLGLYRTGGVAKVRKITAYTARDRPTVQPNSRDWIRKWWA